MWFQSVHDIHHKNSQIAQWGSSRSKITVKKARYMINCNIAVNLHDIPNTYFSFLLWLFIIILLQMPFFGQIGVLNGWISYIHHIFSHDHCFFKMVNKWHRKIYNYFFWDFFTCIHDFKNPYFTYLKDSWPGVSMISKPGSFNSNLEN